MIPHNRPSIAEETDSLLKKVIRSGWLAEGSQCRVFEAQLSRDLNQKYAKVTSSGTAALHLALLAFDIQAGDEVILSTYTCTALLNAIHYLRAKPKLVDLDLQNLGPSLAGIKRAISAKTKAIIISHTFGFPAPIQKIKELGLPVIEDCAQALGTRIGNVPAGSFGDITVLSFYATKMITTGGYGGMVLTRNAKFAKKIIDLSHFDQRKDYKVRYNYSLSDLSAAFGRAQYHKLAAWVKRRQAIASEYQQALKKTPCYFWQERGGGKPNYYRFILGSLKPFRSHLQFMKQNKIQCISPIEPYQLLHRYLKLDPKSFPQAEAISRAVVSVPIYPSLSDSQVKQISTALSHLE